MPPASVGHGAGPRGQAYTFEQPTWGRAIEAPDVTTTGCMADALNIRNSLGSEHFAGVIAIAMPGWSWGNFSTLNQGRRIVKRSGNRPDTGDKADRAW